jgi:hypothetical protein
MPELLLAALPLALALAWLSHMRKRHGTGPLLWRWFSGHALDGQYRTDATWTRKATGVLHPTGRVVRWHHLPRLHRAGIRGTATAGTAGLVVTLAAYRTQTLAVLAAFALVAGMLTGWRAYYLVRRARHYWTWHRPLQRALSAELDVPPPRLEIEPDRSKVTVGLPDEFTGSDREREAIERAVVAKLAIEAPDADWSKLHGKRPRVIFTRSEPPPASVTLAAIRDAIGNAAEHEIVMGAGKKAELTVVSVDNDSPHVGLSMGSGDGKSITARNMAAQLAFHGALIAVLDFKLISHMWARDLPNVSYAGTPAEIEQVMVWLAAEVTRRNQVALAGADIEGRVHANVGPRIFVICEELNSTQGVLKDWWCDEMGFKGRSPGSKALDRVMFLGRQVHVNVLQIGQRLSVKATGSGDARENLGVLVFADPTASAWKMLVGDRHALPPASGHKGRLQVVTKKTVRETQGAFLTGAQARELAVAGTVAVPPHDMPCVTGVPVPVSGDQSRQVASDQGIVVGHAALLPARPPGAVTLQEAVNAQLFPSIAAARKYAQRKLQPVGAEGVSNLYLIADIAATRENR